MTPLAWFIAGGLSALFLARTISRIVYRYWWTLLAVVFVLAVFLARGDPAQALNWLGPFAQFLGP